MSSIVTENLSKIYTLGEVEVRAVDDINIAIDKGEFLSIVGPSGSGKSTLLNLVGCLDKPTTGQVLIDGVDTGGLSRKELTRLRRDNIGFVFQEFNLLPVLNALENVELPLRYLGFSSKERSKKAKEALDMVGLSDRVGNRPAQLSGGERQRVSIARALVTGPALVLADEPTGELDTRNSCKVIELMRDLNDQVGQTFAIVTHDPMVAEYTNRIITLRDGRVASEKKQEGLKECRADSDI